MSTRPYRRIDLLPGAALTLLAALIVLLPAADFFAHTADYLPIHTSLELCSVVVSVMVVGLGWNLRGTADNSHIVILAATFLCVAGLDVLHLLSYAGMPDLVTPSGPEKAINFWLAARVVTAAGLIAMVLLPVETWTQPRATAVILAAMPLATLIALVGLYGSDAIPRTFIEGRGLTTFKMASEYLIMAAYLGAAVVLYGRAVRSQGYNGILLATAAWTMGIGESFFTLYSSVTDTFNLAGHVYKVIAYLYIYQAVFAEGVRAPYRALAEERRDLHKLMQVAPDAILLIDLDSFRIVQANPAASVLLGWSEAELTAKSVVDLYAPDQPGGGKPSEVLANAAMELRRGRLVTGERRLVNRGGDIRDCEARSIAVADLRGRLLIRASFIDVTERKRAEAALAASEARISALFNSTLYGIISIGLDQRIIDFNAAAARMFGIGVAEARGRDLGTLMPERFRASHQRQVEAFARLTAEGPRSLGVPRGVVGLRASGEEFPLEASISGFSTSGVAGMTVLMRDVSAQRLIERQLQQAQKMEAVGQLTGGMAHDFNNILTVIQANLEFLDADLPPDSPAHDLVSLCNRAVDRGTGLTKALLAVARRQPLEPQRVDTAALLRSTADLLQRILGKAVELKLDIREDAWPLRVDPAQMESALLNLSLNARDAMPDGGTLTLGARNLSLPQAARIREIPAGDYTVITVSDTGSGMTPETMAKAFDPFFTTKGSKGTGLGLSMVQGFVSQSGGHVGIDSALGRGTTITIYLPRYRDETKPD